MSDVPVLTFVDPAESSDLYRVVLWAAGGQGKSVMAASAPGPIVVLSADRPGAYRFARKHHAGKDIREVRFQGSQTLALVFKYLRDDAHDVRTLIIDPWGNIYDRLIDEEARGKDPEVEVYSRVNKKMMAFLKALRDLPIHVVIVAHEKLNDGKKGDGKMYPALGGASLINKVVAEVDIIAHVERAPGETQAQDVWGAQLQPRGNLVTKDSTGALGDRRIGDLTEWFTAASAALAPDDTDLPFSLEDPAADPEVEAQIALEAEAA